MLLILTIGQNNFRFTLDVFLSGTALSAILIIIVINLHNQNKQWEQERIDSGNLVKK
jgi:hypothetical protein